MNKKLMAAAVAGAFVTPALVYAQNATVQVYGRATVEYGYADQGTGRPNTDIFQTPGGSAIGFKGQENLGGGMAAWFQCESSADVRGLNQDGFCGRNSAIGLKGAWGNIHYGRWDTPFKATQLLSVDPFGDLTIASPSGITMRQLAFDNRANNVLQYWSPTFSGLMARLAATSNEQKSDAAAAPGTAAGANPRLYSGSLEWTSGPFYVSYAYEKHRDSIANVTPTQGVDETGNGIAAKYTIGWAQISGQFGHYKRTGSDDQKSGMVNLTGTFGVHQGIASYRRSSGGDVSGADQAKCDGFALAYKYLFDRNLDFIAEYVQVNNKTGGLCDFGQNGVGAAATAGGGDPKGIAAGVRYTF